MFYFEFTFILELGWTDKDGSTSYRKNLDMFQDIAKAYDLKISHFETSDFDHHWQKETSCISITLARETKQFRSAYNLLKICEASLSLIEGCGSTVVNSGYDLKQIP